MPKAPPTIIKSSAVDMVTPPAVSPTAAIPAAMEVPAVNGAATIAPKPMPADAIPAFLSFFFLLAFAFISFANSPLTVMHFSFASKAFCKSFFVYTVIIATKFLVCFTSCYSPFKYFKRALNPTRPPKIFKIFSLCSGVDCLYNSTMASQPFFAMSNILLGVIAALLYIYCLLFKMNNSVL